MPCPKDQTRVDRFGRAYKGSQRHIQTYVNLRPIELSQRIVELLTPSPPRDAHLDWVSPLATKGYAEYRDSEFLEVLQLGKHTDALSKFWPAQGPCWDALATLSGDPSKGVVLVEAKSRVNEIYSGGIGAKGSSLRQIEKALAETKAWLAVPEFADWTGPLYQSANRLAHLYFLRQVAGVPAWLVNLYFLNDPYKPTTLKEWGIGLRRVKHELGLNEIVVPYFVELFLKSADSY